MANNSDIIKIGFDYESGLAEFIKNYNGTMDQVQKSADGNRIEIQFDVSDKDVIKKISAIQGDFKNVKIELNGKELKQQLDSVESIKNVLTNMIDAINNGRNIDSLFDFGKINSQVNGLKETVSNSQNSIDNSVQKTIDKYQELKKEIEAVQNAYNKIERNKYEEKDPSFVYYKAKSNVDFSGINDTEQTYENFNLAESKLKEIYNLYKQIQKAIDNNNGYLGDSRYDERDLKNLVDDFKAVAQIYQELNPSQFNKDMESFSKEIGISFDATTEKVKTLKQITGRMSEEFKGYVSEVIEDSKLVAENNKLFDQEASRLKEVNKEAETLYNSLKENLLSKITDKDERFRISEYLPDVDYNRDTYGYSDMPEFGQGLFDKIDVLNEVAKILGIEIPQAAEKTNNVLKEINSSSSNPSSGNDQISNQEKLQLELKDTEEQARKTEQALKNVSTSTSPETNISTPKNTTPDAAGASADDSKVSIEGEADKLKETAQNATEAANAKLKFVDANKKVKDSAKDSADAVQGESDSFKNVNTDPYSTYVQNVYKAWQQADKINDALSETQQKFQSIENTFGKSATGGSRFEELFPGVTAQIKTLDNELTQGNRTLKSYASAIDKLLVKNPESFLKNSESAIQKAEKSLNNLTVPSNLTSEFSNVKTEVESLNEQLRNNKISISDYKLSVSEKISDFGSAIKEQKTALEKTLSEMNTLIGKVDYNVKTGKPVDGMRSSDYSTMMDKYKAELEELRTLQATVSKQDYVSAAQLKQFDDLRKKLKDSETSFKTLSAAEKGSDSLSRAKLYSKIGEYLQKNSGMAKEFKTQLKSLQKQLENDGPNANVKNLTDQFIRLQSQIREAGQEGRSFLDVLKDKAFYGFAGQLSTYFGFNDFVRYIGEGVNTIRELDTAMTEMRKVSDESVSSLKSFQEESFNIANAVGTTALQIQNSTADWMRLGLSLDDAKEAAKDANILLNVSEFDNIEDATKSLVSMSQAYKDLDKLTIVDKLNEVGNNYAISTDELASALQRSSATLSLMGNTIDEAAALVTTANATIQDADSVAAGLRTISLRLVGTSEAEEELSAMNEEVDAFVKATNSKKQQIIKDYTAVASNQYKGFDILDDNGNYKNTYEILLGIAKVYKEIQEQDKKLGTNHAMALIEELAGELYCLKMQKCICRTYLIARAA